jgi:hypothetical protein
MRCLALIALLIGCTQPKSAECKEVCRREAECVDQVDTTAPKIPFDEKECIAACDALQHDVADNGAKVKRHIDCVNKQPSCAAVLECK